MIRGTWDLGFGLGVSGERARGGRGKGVRREEGSG